MLLAPPSGASPDIMQAMATRSAVKGLPPKPTRLVTVAIANETARAAWALLTKGENYKAVPAI